jgi:serine/threonine protein kinase
MRTCPSQELIESYVAGGCSGDEYDSIENHATTCLDCHKRIEHARADLTNRNPSDMETVLCNPNETALKTTDDMPDIDSTKIISNTPSPISHSPSAEKEYEAIFEDYKIEGQIGEGGVGTVWKAIQLSTHRQVALKMLGRGSFVSDKARIRFEREVELTARLEHPNIARIYDSGLHRGMHYYTMELFEGEHLDRYIKLNELTQRQILELMLTVCQAVQYAHQRGVIHRDLKPPNIIVTKGDQAHILDFGLAKTYLEGDKTVTVSLDGDVAGTPAYMSPEQARGDMDALDTRTDVYSLGVILFNVLTDQWPYDISGSHYEVLKNIQEMEPALPSKIIKHFDSDIEAILLKTLAKDPAERYQSAAELAQDIQNRLDGLAITARSVDTLYLLKKMIVRHRKTSIVAGLVLLILLSTSFISVFYYYSARNAIKQLKSEQVAYIKKNEVLLTYTNQVLFETFLEQWFDEEARALVIAGAFMGQSKEKRAVTFLIDKRELSEKIEDIQKELEGNGAAFWHFILGEHYLKNNNKTAAIEAYQKSVEMRKTDSSLQDWFVNRARRKLDILLVEKMMSGSKSNQGNGG